MCWQSVAQIKAVEEALEEKEAEIAVRKKDRRGHLPAKRSEKSTMNPLY